MKNQLLYIITAVILFLSPNVIFAQTPQLGTAGNFVLFTTAGAVTNTGTSHLTGDVGTNTGASTGFGNVNGVMHNGDDSTGAAAADLLNLYTQLDTITPTFFPDALLGNGDTLTPGVYQIAEVATLEGILYLNAQGNANAIFIIQIEAAFSTNESSKVMLLNGAQACNVFWKVEGAIQMATKTFMRGTVVANNDALSMGALDTLEGRALAIAGAINLNGVTAYLPTGCGSIMLTGPAAPSLGVAACFAVFSGNGSVANSGISHITGDVGTNAGLTTGYDPLYVTGFIHPIPDGFTASASTNLLSAYNYLNTLPNDIELMYPAQFGQNLVLTPHTYIMNGAATFTDSLYLDAKGNYNAIFVIKVKGALTSVGASSKVILLNGAQAKNIYWVVDGAVSISSNSIFNGTIICNNGAIDISTGSTLNGRALTTGGALSTAQIIATSPSGNCNLLPVSWLYFNGKPDQKNVKLEWGTTNDINNGFFTIEKSIDGRTFEILTKITAQQETEKAACNYSFTDYQPYNVGYYRISQTDKDGKVNYYRTIQIKFSVSQGFKAMLFVQQSFIQIQASGATPGNGSIELYDLNGKKTATQKILLTKEVSTYKIQKPLHKGIYLLNIMSKGERLYNSKVMIP
jgi:hypothetical protein